MFKISENGEKTITIPLANSPKPTIFSYHKIKHQFFVIAKLYLENVCYFFLKNDFND